MTIMTASVAFLIHTGNMRPWMMFSYMLLSSVCSVLDTTNRPALIYDVLFASGAEHFVGTAMALRSVRALMSTRSTMTRMQQPCSRLYAAAPTSFTAG